MTASFCRYQLRTTDIEGARAFYEGVLSQPVADIIELSAEARARGARPHWLGHVGVVDVERAVQEFIDRGATRLGPARSPVLRDPGGAIVAIAEATSGAVGPEVSWHLLNTLDPGRARASYCEVFGWHIARRTELGPLGVFHEFAWREGAPTVGSMTDISARPEIHPHWLFLFRVSALDRALAYVRSAGGVVTGSFVLAAHSRVAVCEDPQGGAFGLQASA